MLLNEEVLAPRISVYSSREWRERGSEAIQKWHPVQRRRRHACPGNSTRELILATPHLIEVPTGKILEARGSLAHSAKERAQQCSAAQHHSTTASQCTRTQPRCLALIFCQLALNTPTDTVRFKEAFSILRRYSLTFCKSLISLHVDCRNCMNCRTFRRRSELGLSVPSHVVQLVLFLFQVRCSSPRVRSVLHRLLKPLSFLLCRVLRCTVSTGVSACWRLPIV